VSTTEPILRCDIELWKKDRNQACADDFGILVRLSALQPFTSRLARAEPSDQVASAGGSAVPGRKLLLKLAHRVVKLILLFEADQIPVRPSGILLSSAMAVHL
jgi:hypothetical protein